MLFPHEQFSHQTMAEVEKYYFHAAFSRKAQTYYRVQIISVCKGRWIIEKNSTYTSNLVVTTNIHPNFQ